MQTSDVDGIFIELNQLAKDCLLLVIRAKGENALYMAGHVCLSHPSSLLKLSHEYMHRSSPLYYYSPTFSLSLSLSLSLPSPSPPHRYLSLHMVKESVKVVSQKPVLSDCALLPTVDELAPPSVATMTTVIH